MTYNRGATMATKTTRSKTKPAATTTKASATTTNPTPPAAATAASSPHRAELEAILAGADDLAVLQQLHAFFPRWTETDALDAEVALIEKRLPSPRVSAQPRWIERAMCGEPEPRMRLARTLFLMGNYAFKVRGKKLGDEHAVNLCNAAHLQNIAEFGSSVATPFGPDACAAFASARTMTNLRALDLNFTKPGKAGAAALGAGPSLARLEKLSLVECKLGDAGVEAFARGGALTALRELSLARNKLGAKATRALGASAMLAGLRALSLSQCELDEAALRALIDAPTFGGLEALNLAGNRYGLSADALDALARSPLVGRLRRLDLADVPLTASFVDALVARAAPVEELVVRNTRLTARDAAALLGGALPALRRLDLGWCPLGVEGARAIVAAPGFAQLRSLELSECGLGDDGVRALAAAKDLSALEYLGASHNGCSRESWRALVDAPSLAPAVRADLDGLTQHV